MDTYSELPLKDSLSLPASYTQAAHVMLYARWPGKLFDKYEHKYTVMMQVRFDGMLGFPGGIVDDGETPAQAVTREFNEEEVTFDLYVQVEKCPQSAKHWGTEVFGVVRCPLYTLPNGLGLPGFIKHGFIGSALHQFQLGLIRRGLLSQEEWDTAVETSKRITGLVTKEEIDY